MRFFAALLALAGCGGGGGSGGSVGELSGQEGAGSTALKFTSTNAGQVAGYPFWVSEALMRISNALSDEVVATIKSTTPEESGSCQGVGTWSRTFDGKDRNGAVSAGDLITVRFVTCKREPLAQSAEGQASAKIVSVIRAGGFVAEATIPAPGMGLSTVVGDVDQDFRVSGRALLQLSVSDTRRTLVVGNGGSDEVVFDFPWLLVGGDRLTAFRKSKSHHWDEARTYLDLKMRYTSPSLGGGFDVSTPVSITSWLDTLPEPRPGQGWLLMTGAANDQVRIDVMGAGGLDLEIGVKADFGGDGIIDAAGDFRWSDAGLVSGFFFADYTPGGRAATYACDPDEFSVRAPFVASTSVAVKDVLTMQMTRPPVGATDWTWRLFDIGAVSGFPGSAQEVPVTVKTLCAMALP